MTSAAASRGDSHQTESGFKKEAAMLKARSKRTISIFLLSAACCLFLLSCENPFIQQILEYKTVSFNTNGGSHVPVQNLIKGQKITQPDDPVKPDSFFAGWYIDNDTFVYEWDFDDVPAEDMTLYAKWVEDERIQITHAAVTVAPPETGQEPAVTAYAEGEANYSIAAVSWSPNDDLFQQDTPYTVYVTLRAYNGYTFRGLTYAYINEQTAGISGNTGDTVTLSLTFGLTTEIFVEFNLQAAVEKYKYAEADMTIMVPGSLLLTDNITVPASAEGHTLTITSGNSGPYNIYRGQQDTDSDHGLFIVSSGANLVFENIVIDGRKTIHTENAASLVRVNGIFTQGNTNIPGGTFTLGSGAVLRNNKASSGGGVYVNYNSNFYMDGGTISGNTAASGGGVYVGGYSSVFKMTDGVVLGNQADYGGGVYVTGNGTFNMSGGVVLGNEAVYDGGGVFLKYLYGEGHGTFNMSGNARVLGNTALNGGGVYIDGMNSCFKMEGGTISGNTAKESGGGVYVGESGSFYIISGTVYGKNATGGLANNATNEGAALFVGDYGTAENGFFSGDGWQKMGDLITTDIIIELEGGAYG